MQSTMAGTSLFGISRPVEATGAKALLASWRELVYKCIADLKSKYPRSNDSQLAARIRVNRTSYIRFTSEIQKPQLENYLKLVVGSGNGHLASDALRLYDEDLGKVFEGVFKEGQTSVSKVSYDVGRILDEKGLFVTYVLCLKEKGTNLLEAENVLGSEAQFKLDELVCLGLVTVKNNTYFGSENDLRVKFGKKLRTKFIQELNTFYKVNSAPTHINYSQLQTEGLTLEGALLVQQMHMKFFEELKQVFTDPKYKGDIPFFSNSVCDSLTTELFEKVRVMNEGGAI